MASFTCGHRESGPSGTSPATQGRALSLYLQASSARPGPGKLESGWTLPLPLVSRLGPGRWTESQGGWSQRRRNG